MHRAGREAGKPAPAVAGRTIRSQRGMGSGHESQRLDHLVALGSPQPGAPGDQRVGRSERERPAGERRAVRDEAPPRVARKNSGVGVAAAASTSQARVEVTCMDRSSAGRASVVISVSAGVDAL